MTTISKIYDPKKVEDTWYAYWQENNFFHGDVETGKAPFCVVIPPPNVTGQLHMGHALDETYQDILVRFKRMQGYNTVWVPGTDHAGIATQAKVEDHLRETEGQTRHTLGREAFLERVWKWKEEYGARITDQLKKLGASCDWERERFTMDEGCSLAVRAVFVELYEKGHIYQGHYSVNWCPSCRTTLSDIEVEHEEHLGKLYHIRYPLKDGSGHIMVATTRPETLLGDTAIAVHPEDARYTALLGKEVIVPLLHREIPVIADAFVDPAFGTGMVKVTPAHDPNDFEMGERHNLARVRVIGPDAKMTEDAGPYAQMDRYACREQVIKDLAHQGLLVKVVDHNHSIGQCYRCDTIVEPLVSKQWFVRMKPLAKRAIDVVKDGTVKFHPERFSKLYLHWMENIRDWCISRQLWWGHRIPAFYCQDCGHTLVTLEDPATCSSCKGENLLQDPDVLDTWFSSALWPFSTLGWPEKTPELAHFYPTAVLVTGFDIINFWVARMIFMGLEFMDKAPFHDVLIHGLVRDSSGRKMSKSLGNGVDPLLVIDQYGADALRFNLVIGVAPGNDLRFASERVEAYRNFANKIWNASRFVLMNLEDFEVRPNTLEELQNVEDRWILLGLNHTIAEVNRLLERYDLGESARVLYDFIWSELCDWYIEWVKPRLYGKRGEESRYNAQYVLWHVLKQTLELLHPFMPFITEEIWQHLPHEGETILYAPYPKPRVLVEDQAAKTMRTLQDVITAIRTLRSEKQVPPGKKIRAILMAEEKTQSMLALYSEDVRNLAGLEELEIRSLEESKPASAIGTVAAGIQVFLPLSGLVNRAEERVRVSKEIKQAEEELKRAKVKLGNPGFTKQAPEAVIEKEREKVLLYEDRLEKLLVLLEELKQ